MAQFEEIVILKKDAWVPVVLVVGSFLDLF